MGHAFYRETDSREVEAAAQDLSSCRLDQLCACTSQFWLDVFVHQLEASVIWSVGASVVIISVERLEFSGERKYFFLTLHPFTFLFKLGAIFAKRVVHRKQELHFVLDLGVILWPPEFFSLDQVQVQISYISFLVDEDVLKQRLTDLFFRQRLTIFLNVNFV